MAEHVLRGEIAIYPRAEGGRQLIVSDLGEIYRIPLPEEAVDKVVTDLSMDDDELMAELKRRQEAQHDLMVPGGANGRQIIRP